MLNKQNIEEFNNIFNSLDELTKTECINSKCFPIKQNIIYALFNIKSEPLII